MEIDQHPFPANMVDAGGKNDTLQSKVLTSESAKESRAIGPKVQVSADDVKGADRRKQSAQRHLGSLLHLRCC